jgi:hypothetical protein
VRSTQDDASHYLQTFGFLGLIFLRKIKQEQISFYMWFFAEEVSVKQLQIV